MGLSLAGSCRSFRMKTFAVIAVALVGCAGLVGRADDKPAKGDAPKLEGKYTLVSGTKNGTDVDDNAKKAKYEFEAKTITIDMGDMKFVMTYTLDGKGDTAKIDMEITESPIADLKGSKAYGIVEKKGDTLKLAYALEKDKRPTDYSGKDGFTYELKTAK